MDHVVCLDSEINELEDLLSGIKTMIIRGADRRRLPYGSVKEGDILYFISNRERGKIDARGVVSSVFCSDNLSEEESFEVIIRNQDKLQLPDKEFEKLAGKRCLTLISLNDIKEVEPFQIDKKDFQGPDDWFPIGKIDKIISRSFNITGTHSF
ncbi:MAG TPA: hypothetical protein PLR88_02115 [Bacteroidales bacterium]|nr:hypothetical protein [Bacteroidales bacterium]